MQKLNLKLKEKSTKGITLIALVITIVILLILAGVGIAMLTGDNGILTQAQNAKEKTEKASELEGIQLAVIGSETKNNEYLDILDAKSFKEELEKNFSSEELDVVANGDGSFIVTINDRKYYVNNDKTVISSDNIIEINDEQGLMNFRDDVNNGNSYEGKAVLLTSDITLSGEWKPIGFIDSNTDEKNPETGNNKAFKGIFDGCNHTIKNLKISSTDNKYNGLFSFVIDGTIKNITIGENSKITGSNGAGVVGYLYGFEGNISNCVNYANTNGAGIVRIIAGQHTISNCKNYGTIIGGGGILGSSNGTDWKQFENVSNTIINCGNYGNLTGNEWYAGGIAGYFKGKISNSYNKGTIIGTGGVGGVVGTIEQGNIRNCYNMGGVNANEESAGGIAGGLDKKTNLINCYNVGEIKNESQKTGGIIGSINSDYNDVIEVKSCINYASITTHNYGGGIIGYNNANVNVKNCYNLGNISGDIGISSIIGYTSTGNANINNCFYLNTVTQDKNAVAINIDEMPNPMDIINGENKFQEDKYNINKGYPVFTWQKD